MLQDIKKLFSEKKTQKQIRKINSCFNDYSSDYITTRIVCDKKHSQILI